MQDKKHFILFSVFVVIMTIVTMSLFHPYGGYVIGDDLGFHLNRFASISKAMDDGRFPFYADAASINGYGYAENFFYPDSMLIPFALLINVLGLVSAYKLMLFVSFLLCAFLTYYCVKKVFKNNNAAMITSLLYTFSFYRIADMSIRAALGEYLAFSFIPLVLLGGYTILCGNYKRGWIVLSIGFSCLILSHLISAFLVFIVFCIFLLFYYKRLIEEPARIGYLILSGIVTVFLSAFFLFPMLEQMANNTFYLNTSPFVEDIFYQTKRVGVLITSLFKGFGWKYAGYADSYIGIGALLVIPLVARFFIREKTAQIRFADISVFVGVFLLVMMSTLFPWRLFPFNKLTIIQFPWRFIQEVTFLFACSVGVYLSVILSKYKPKAAYILYAVLPVLIFVSVFLSSKAYHGLNLNSNGTLTQVDNSSALNTTNIGIGQEYIPAAVPSFSYIIERGDKVESKSGNSNVTNLNRNKSVFSFDVDTRVADDLILPLLYYKGYKAELDGHNIEVRQSEKGLVEVSVYQSGELIVYYYGTFIQRMSLLLSFLTLIALCVYWYDTNRKKTKIKTKNEYQQS